MNNSESHDLSFEQEVVGTIDHIDLVVVKLPFVTPFAISSAVWTAKEALLLRLDSDGITAWGECVADPDPFYSCETITGDCHIIKEFLLPLVEPGVSLGEIDRKFRHVRGNGMAKATVENALLDLIAKRKQIPLHKLLGWPRKKIMSGISIGIQESPAALLAVVEEAVQAGYHRVKMKIKRGKDIEFVQAVRERFPDIKLMVDANGDYRLEDAGHLKQLDRFNLLMIEQPLSYSDIYQHSILQKQLATALCLDESIHDLDDAKTAVALGSCRIINIKQGRVGGLMEANPCPKGTMRKPSSVKSWLSLVAPHRSKAISAMSYFSLSSCSVCRMYW